MKLMCMNVKFANEAQHFVAKKISVMWQILGSILQHVDHTVSVTHVIAQTCLPD